MIKCFLFLLICLGYSCANLFMKPSFSGKMDGGISTSLAVQEEIKRVDELDVKKQGNYKHRKKCKCGFSLLLSYVL